MVPYLLGGVVIAFLAFVVIGGLTGRVKAQSCCSLTADPQKDARLRGAGAPTDSGLD